MQHLENFDGALHHNQALYQTETYVMAAREILHLVPPLVEAGKFNDLVKTGQTVSSALCPSDNTVLVFIKDEVRCPNTLYLISDTRLTEPFSFGGGSPSR